MAGLSKSPVTVVTLWIERRGASLLRPEEIRGCRGSGPRQAPAEERGGRDGNKAKSHTGRKRDKCESLGLLGVPRRGAMTGL